jgi:DNA-binding transcriptional MerR regulator
VNATLTIGELARRSGVAVPTLRAWERRYGFPRPQRLPSGHRRYELGDVSRVRAVARARESGIALATAVESLRPAREERDASIFAGVRRASPDLTPYLLPKHTLLGLSHAIEDECCARAERPLLFASFQRVRFWERSRARWSDLARTAHATVVFADFDRPRTGPSGTPVELPIDRSDPFGREWSVVCDAPDYAVFLAGWERPGQVGVPDGSRQFETVWSVEPRLVRDASNICLGLVDQVDSALGARLRRRVEEAPPPASEELRVIGALTNRMVAYVGAGEPLSLPAPHSSAAG